MVNSAETRLAAAGIELPPAPAPFGAYVPAVQTGNLLFLTGMLPMVGHEAKFLGRAGRELNAEQGRRAAYAAALNVLAVANQHLGSLDRISRVVRLGVYIATAQDFSDHVTVADAASELLRDILGKDKMSTRLVFGVENWTTDLSRSCGHLPETGSLYASLTNGMTGRITGIAPTAMRTGNSTMMDS